MAEIYNLMQGDKTITFGLWDKKWDKSFSAINLLQVNIEFYSLGPKE